MVEKKNMGRETHGDLSANGDTDAALSLSYVSAIFFFFQAEDGIRDVAVTGVQTCALPICQQVQVGDLDADLLAGRDVADRLGEDVGALLLEQRGRLAAQKRAQIGRASCRERV